MRKNSIILVLILVTILVSGFSCSGDSGDITSCGLSVCPLCGTYISQADSNNYIEIRSDGTAYLHQGGFQTSGTWRYNQVELMINWQGDLSPTRWEVGIKTIRDDDGIVWVKQAVDASGAGTSAPPF